MGGTCQTFLLPSNQKHTDACGVRRICLHSSGRGFISISISIVETEKQCFERETSLFMFASLWLAWPPDMISPCSGSQPDVIDIHKCLKFASEYFLCLDQYCNMNESCVIRFKVRRDQRTTGCVLCLMWVNCVCVSCGISGPCLCSYVKGLFCFFVYKQCICKCVSIYKFISYTCKDVNCALFILVSSMEVLSYECGCSYTQLFLLLGTIYLKWQNI